MGPLPFCHFTHCLQTYGLVVTTAMPPFLTAVVLGDEHPHGGGFLHLSSGALLSQASVAWLDKCSLSLACAVPLSLSLLTSSYRHLNTFTSSILKICFLSGPMAPFSNCFLSKETHISASLLLYSPFSILPTAIRLLPLLFL